LCADADDIESNDVNLDGFPQVELVVNSGKKGAATGWNVAVANSTGKVIVCVADDWEPPPHWDTELLRTIPDIDGEFVIEVSVGGEADNRRLLPFSVLSRKRYERFGYVFHPDYYGLFADDEFTDVARRDGVVIDARHLMFPHHHFTTGASPMDEIYARQNNWAVIQNGCELYQRRKESGFAN
jgi:glycosyltransferase involved in cell wall biosynthesis